MNLNEQTIYDIVDKAKKYNDLLVIQKKPILCCSFCGHSQNEVDKLIAGVNVFICNECIELCNEIIEAEKEDDMTEDSN